MFPELQRVCQEQGIKLSKTQLDAFAQYRDALYKWNKNKNLTRVPIEDCDVRHFAESCLLIKFTGDRGGLLDLGTGPGLPAWPMACACPNLEVTAIDSNGKMLDFLRSQPLPNLRVLEGRVEELGTTEAYGVVTGRAFAPLSIQLECSVRPCKVGGAVIPFRSNGEEFDLDCLDQLGLEFKEVWKQPLADGRERVLPIYEKVRETPDMFPRPWAMIKKRPLD
ncbi:MAG: class I SAM-dependent methyltransferase [Chthonomonas sp.]|nr:class I SAM-dependent methyltransferase [Chthonomonas sp.]